MLGLLPNLQILRCVVAERDSSSLSRYNCSAVFSEFGKEPSEVVISMMFDQFELILNKSLVCWLVCTYFFPKWLVN